MEIHKIAAIILKDKKTLVVKKNLGDIFISPGGRVEGEETPEQTLRRELKEELDVNLISMKPFGIFRDKSTYEDAQLIMDTYFAEIEGELKPQAEIEKFEWVGKDYDKQNIKIASILHRFIFPKLIEEGLIE